MPYTYQDYLNEQNVETKSEPESTYKFSDYLAEQKKPEKKKRKLAPGFEAGQPTDEDLKLTLMEKIAKVAGPAIAQTARFGGKVAEFGNELYGVGGLLAEGLGNMASPGRLEQNAIAQALYKIKNEGKDVGPQIAEQALEFANTPAEKFVQDVGAGGFDAAIKLPMYNLLGLPITMGLEKAADVRSAGGNLVETGKAALSGGVEGLGTHGALGLIGGGIPGKVLPRVVAGGGAAADALLRGGTPEQAAESAILMAAMTKGRGKAPITAKGQRAAEINFINKTNEITWRNEQRKKQEKLLDEKIIKSMEDNLNRPTEPKLEIITKKQLAEEKPPELGKDQPATVASIEEGNRGEGWSWNSRTNEMTNIKTDGDFPTGKGIVNARQNKQTGEFEVDASSDRNVFNRTSEDAFINKVKTAKQTPEEGAIPEYSTAEVPASKNAIAEPGTPGTVITQTPMAREAKPIEPTTVPNQHATKASDKAREISENSSELAYINREWEKPVAEHLQMNLNEQARMAGEIEPTLAREIALGRESVPSVKGADGHLLKTEAVWVSEKNKAIANSDVDYIRELAKNSPVQEQISQAGKSLVILRNRNPQDPVYQIMEINKEAKNTVEKSLGNKKVKEASDRRVVELEKLILEKTKHIEELENRKTIREFKYEARKRGRIRTKEELGFEFDDLAKELNRHVSTQMNIGLDPKIIKLMGRMAINKVESGYKTIEQVVDDIYTTIGGKIDRRAIRDAITGYGKTAKLSKDDIDKELREVKRQGRLVSMLEDAEMGTAPLRTGLQRDKPSARVKELRQLVEDVMRKNGLLIEKSAKSPEEQQLTAIQKYKNYLTKRYSELTEQLKSGDYTTKPRKVTPVDPQMKSAKENIDRLTKMHRSLKEINELRDTGVTRAEATKIIELSKVVSDRKNAVTDWNDRSPDGPALEYGRSLVDFFDYSNGLKQRARKLTGKEIISKAIHEPLKSIGHGMSVASGTSKSILSSMDNSALGRQGIKMLWSHPTVWARNAKQSWVDLFGKHSGKVAMREVMAEVLSRPNSINGTYGKMKLDVGNIEEAYPVQAPEKIPGFGRAYKRTEAAFTGFQYRNRADAADLYLKLAEKMGVDVADKVQLESIGNLVNTLTGRGKFGKNVERAAGALNNVFFAPKFFKSNWDFLTMHMTSGDTGFVKQQAAINMMKFVAGTAAVLTVAKALGADIELNPLSSDFAKIRVKSTRFDITGGVAAVATLATRLIGSLASGLIIQPLGGKPLNTTKSSVTGKTYPLTAGGAYQRKGLDVLVDAIGGKLAPLASLVKSGLSGVDNNRKPLTLDGILLNALLPIGWQNVIQGMSNKDRANWIATYMADFVGVGTSTYGKAKKKNTEWKVFNQ